MKKFCAMLLSASILNAPMTAAGPDKSAVTAGETTKFGTGAAGGTIHGNHAAGKNDAIAALEKQLKEKTLALAALQNEYEAARIRYAGNLRQAVMENKMHSLWKLGDGIAFPVYFRTNDSGVTPEVEQQLRKMAALVRDYPEIRVRLDAYADERGLPSYNLQLSRARALSVQHVLTRAGLSSRRILQYAHGEVPVECGDGDTENYIFDRRVDVRLTLNTET